MSFLASPTLRLLLASLALSGLALTGCSGQVGSTCQQPSDCASGLTCSNVSSPSTWPRGTCVLTSQFDASVGADVFTAPDAFSTEDAFGEDAFVPVDAYTAPDAYSPSGCVTPPSSGAIALTGTTVGAPSAPRPEPTFFEDCPSDLASSVPFRSHAICANSVSATYEIRVSGSIPDSFLVLYEGLSVPSDRSDCALLDDDSAGAGQAMITVDVTAGTPFTAMVTGYNPSDVGPYTLTIRRL